MQALRKLSFGVASLFSGDRARRASLALVLFTVFVLPAFSMPGIVLESFSREEGKAFFVLLTVSAAAFFFVAAYRRGEPLFLRIYHPAASAAIIVLVTSLLATVFSEAPLVSLFGDFYEVGTFLFTFFALILFGLTAVLFRVAMHAVFALTVVVASFLFLSLAEVARALNAGTFAVVREASLVGSLLDAIVLALFVGVVSIVMLALLRVRAVGRVVAVLGIITTIGWGAIVGIPHMSSTVPAATHDETIQLAREVLKNESSLRALLGSGPLLFFHQWEQYMPQAATQTRIERGPSLFSTLLITHGLLGLLAWLLFLGALAYGGAQAVVRSRGQRRRYILALSIPALFLWGALFFYYPGTVVFTLAMIFSGLLVGATPHKDADAPAPRVLRMIIPGVLAGIVVLALFVVKDAAAIPLFARGEALYREGATVEGRALMLRAASLSPRDAYYRTLGQLDYERIKSMLPTTRERAAQFIEGADRGSGKALAYNPADYQNWSLFARVQVLFAQLEVRGDALERADEAYQGASLRNPYRPTLYLEHAYLLALLLDDLERAEQAAQQALALDPSLGEAEQLLTDIHRIRQQE